MIEIENIQEIGAGTAIVGLLIAFMLYNKINKIEISNPIVADITQQIQKGHGAILNLLSNVCDNWIANLDFVNLIVQHESDQ